MSCVVFLSCESGAAVRAIGETIVRQMAGVALAGDELAHKICGWCAQDLFRCGVLLDLAVCHDENARAQTQGFRDVVGDKEHGDAGFAVDAGDLLLQTGAGDLVDGAEGLVHEQDLWRRGERPRDADALLLTAGKLGGIALEQFLVEPDDREPFGDGGIGACFVFFIEQIRHVGDVLCDGHVRKEHAALDGVANVAAQLDEIHCANVAPHHADRAGVWREQAVDHFQHRGLAAAGGTDDGHKIARRDGEGKIAKHGFFAVGFAHVFKFNDRFHEILLIISDRGRAGNPRRLRAVPGRRFQRRGSFLPYPDR